MLLNCQALKWSYQDRSKPVKSENKIKFYFKKEENKMSEYMHVCTISPIDRLLLNCQALKWSYQDRSKLIKSEKNKILFRKKKIKCLSTCTCVQLPPIDR